MKAFATLTIALTVLMALAGIAGAQTPATTGGTWAPLNNAYPGTNGAGPMLQLRDGRILVDDVCNTQWWVLTPDTTGSYVNGTWSSGGNTPAGYGPIYFGSQVLTDGRTVVIEGGEYNITNNCSSGVWTNLGARLTYSGGSFTWAANSPPAGWGSIGDAESVLLPNGNYMQATCCFSIGAENAIYNGPNSWTMTGSVLQPSNDESGFTLLTNDKVLTVDAKFNFNCNTNVGTELYDQSSGMWSCAAHTPVQLYNANDEELGSAVLMYNNKVFQMGGNVVASALYDVAGNTWSSGPTPPNGLDQADGPGALEPNGKVLEMLSPGLFQFNACQMMEYDPSTGLLTNTANPTNCPSDSSYLGHFMILPTGQIMFTDFTGLVEVYTPASGIVAAAKPTILAASTNLTHGSTNNLLYGKQLNGLSQNNAYGDDYQGDTDYPLVRLTNTSTSHVYWALTHSESTHSIAPGKLMYTKFDLPASIPAGTYSLVSIANGIASNAITVAVK